MSQVTKRKELIRMLAVVGYELWSSHIIGGAPPSHQKRYARIKDPRPGDLVIEISTSGFWRRDGRPSADGYAHIAVENAIGFLERVTREPFPREEDEPEWDAEAEGMPEPLDKCIYLRLLDGREFRWTNAEVVCILPAEGWHD